jgi:phosphotransferase system  glucose/maltose/N-acetylglucosamine-specific IIC component
MKFYRFGEVSDMDPNTRETIILALIALLIAGTVVGLILVIFLLSGHQDLLSQMLQSTAKGELFGVTFTAGGPFGMWVIAFLLFRYTIKGALIRSVKLILRFPDSQVPPPSQPADFRNAECQYLIFSNGHKVNEKKVTIQTDQIDENVYMPYIYVKVPKIENPEFQISLKYEGEEWLSDSYSPKKGNVDLR